MSMEQEKVPSQDEVLKVVGSSLLLLQTVEHILALVMSFVFQKPNLTPQKLFEESQKNSKRTAGYLLTELHKRVDVHPGFDKTLILYLESRNTFVHRLGDIPGWDLGSPTGRRVAMTFLMDLVRRSTRVLFVFGALARLWAKEAKIKVDFDHEFLQELEAKYGPLVDVIFSEKT
jgi:hypothetical protein